MNKSYCSALILDTNKAITNTNNTHRYLEWFVDFKTLLGDDFKIGALYNLNLVGLISTDAATDSNGLFTLESECLVFTNNADLLNAGDRYVLSNKAVYPYTIAGATNAYTNPVEGYPETFKLTSAKGYIRLQHRLQSQFYIVDNTQFMGAHVLNFDIYRIQ